MTSTVNGIFRMCTACHPTSVVISFSVLTEMSAPTSRCCGRLMAVRTDIIASAQVAQLLGACYQPVTCQAGEQALFDLVSVIQERWCSCFIVQPKFSGLQRSESLAADLKQGRLSVNHRDMSHVELAHHHGGCLFHTRHQQAVPPERAIANMPSVTGCRPCNVRTLVGLSSAYYS